MPNFLGGHSTLEPSLSTGCSISCASMPWSLAGSFQLDSSSSTSSSSSESSFGFGFRSAELASLSFLDLILSTVDWSILRPIESRPSPMPFLTLQLGLGQQPPQAFMPQSLQDAVQSLPTCSLLPQ